MEHHSLEEYETETARELGKLIQWHQLRAYQPPALFTEFRAKFDDLKAVGVTIDAGRLLQEALRQYPDIGRVDFDPNFALDFRKLWDSWNKE